MGELAIKRYGSYAVLKHAISGDKFELAKVLLKDGATVNLNLASTEAQVDTDAASLEDHKTSEADQLPVLSKEASETPLHLIAAKYDHGRTREICWLLLLRGANVDAINSDGETPLHVAAKNNIACCEMLLRGGANVNAINSDGETPLHVAAKNNRTCCEMLLREGANVDVTDICGSTPLHYAARWRKMRREKPRGQNQFPRGQRRNVYRDHAETVPLIRYFMRPSVTANVNCANKIGETPLLIAAKHYNEEGVVLLLNAGANVNVSDQDGLTPLHYAAKWRQTTGVELLLLRSANINCANKIGETPLLIAAKQDNKKGVVLLLNAGANVNVSDQDGLTPLHYAAKWRQTTGVESLLLRSANINSVSKNGDTPLHFAAGKGNLENVRIMLNYGANVNAENNRGERPLHVAMRESNLNPFDFLNMCTSPSKGEVVSVKGRGWDYTRVADELLEHGADINAQNLVGETAVHVAIPTSAEALIEWLVHKGCNVNTKTINNLTPLHYAARAGKLRIVESLLKNGANIDVSDENDLTPLDMAIRATGSEEASIRCALDGISPEATAEILFGLRPNVNAQSKVDVKLLHSVIERRWINLLRKMLSCCSDVVAFINAVSDEGFTSLHVAAKYSRESIVQLLLSSGAVVNFSDNSGNTPLCYTSCVKIAKIFFEKEATGQICPDLFCNAVKEKCIQFIDVLLHKGADVNAKNKYGMTALHIACSSGNGKIVKLLLERGAEVDIRDSRNGYTALHFAASCSRNADVISTLLEGGADIDCGNNVPTVVDCIDIDSEYRLTIDSGTEAQSLMQERSCASGKTALYVAVERNHETNVRALLEFGADVNIKYGDCTPLMCAMKIRSGGIVEVLRIHIAWLKSMGSFVNGKDLQASDWSGPVSLDLEIKFEEEVAKIKKTKIGNSNASFYDFLTKSLIQLAILYSNENIKENLNARVIGCLAIDFPFYGPTINRRLKLAEERMNLLKQTSTVFKQIFALPDLCIPEITGYLRNRDLKSLIDACQ